MASIANLSGQSPEPSPRRKPGESGSGGAKRGPGMRAGLTHERVMEAGIDLLDAAEGTFTLRELARRLGVRPNALSARYAGGFSQILADMTQYWLNDVARKRNPDESCERFLHGLFREIRISLVGRPALAMHVGAALSSDYLLSLSFAECLLEALVHAGISPEYLPDAFDQSVAALVSFIMTDLPLASSPSRRQRLRVLRRSFPTLIENRGSLVAMIEMRREAATKLEPDLTRADAFAKLLLRDIDAVRERATRLD